MSKLWVGILFPGLPSQDPEYCQELEQELATVPNSRCPSWGQRPCHRTLPMAHPLCSPSALSAYTSFIFGWPPVTRRNCTMAAGQWSSLYFGICEHSRRNPERLQVPMALLKTRTSPLAVNPLIQLGLLKVGIISELFNISYSTVITL